MIQVPPVGSTILVTFPKKPYNQRITAKVISTDVENDSFGTIKLQILKDEIHTTREIHAFEWYEKRLYPDLSWSTQTTRKLRYLYNEDGSKKMVKETKIDAQPCLDRFSIVEELWFDEELTGRRVEILK